jgi:hypothetical protein
MRRTSCTRGDSRSFRGSDSRTAGSADSARALRGCGSGTACRTALPSPWRSASITKPPSTGTSWPSGQPVAARRALRALHRRCDPPAERRPHRDGGGVLQAAGRLDHAGGRRGERAHQSRYRLEHRPRRDPAQALHRAFPRGGRLLAPGEPAGGMAATGWGSTTRPSAIRTTSPPASAT